MGGLMHSTEYVRTMHVPGEVGLPVRFMSQVACVCVSGGWGRGMVALRCLHCLWVPACALLGVHQCIVQHAQFPQGDRFSAFTSVHQPLLPAEHPAAGDRDL